MSDTRLFCRWFVLLTGVLVIIDIVAGIHVSDMRAILRFICSLTLASAVVSIWGKSNDK